MFWPVSIKEHLNDHDNWASFLLILTLQITKDITVRLQLRSFKKQPTFNQTHALGFPFALV